jgi:predicted nucleotidyltransferase
MRPAESRRVICAIDELQRRIAPVAAKYGLPAVHLFGSYARGEATDDSDVDILVDRTGTTFKWLSAMGGLFNDFEKAVGKPIDLIGAQS